MSHISIVPAVAPLPPRTLVWDVINIRSGDQIGQIRFYGPWRQYCFLPAPATVFSAGCLGEIAEFIAAHKNDRRESLEDLVENRKE